MSVLTPKFRRITTTRCACVLLSVFGALSFAAGEVHAQVQEGRMAEILHPDRTRASDLGNKAFASSAMVGSKQAVTRPFAYSRSAAFGGADGAYRTRSFADRDKFRTGEYATKADRASSGDSFTAGDRGFATKALPVATAPGANKSAPVPRRYTPGDPSIVIQGKRQDFLDDLYRQKNLSIDQVRQILNKPGSGMEAPSQTVDAIPVLRALPVAAPAVR